MYTQSTKPPSYSPTYSPSNYDPHPAQSGKGWNFHSAPRVAGDVPSAVKSLLVSTKQLQDILRRWSIGQVDEAQVSDVYVTIGTEFNSTVRAFALHGIDMADMQSIPAELRHVLEQCLGEDPSPRLLAQYMPEIRQILYKLLEGLRTKQPQWRETGGRGFMSDQ